jgi:glycosyltransferase involved in cell wall biosynthesis
MRHTRPIAVLHAAEQIRGGVASVVNLLSASHVAYFGIENVVCLIPAGEELTDYPGSVSTFCRTGRNVSSWLSFAMCFIASVWTLRPAIVHLHSTFAGVIGRVLLILLWPVRRSKIVYCPHGWAFIMDVSKNQRRLYAIVERLLASIADAIICVSRYEYDVAITHKLPSARLHVIYNGVPPANPTAALAESPYCIGNLNLLYVGRFDKAKGFDVLLTAMEHLKGEPIRLTAVGASTDGTEHHPSVLASVDYTGWLTPEKLAPYFAHANVVVVPSRWDAFGLVVVEAMSYGKAVVASNVCSLSELVTHGKTGLLFDTGNAVQLAGLLRDTARERWAAIGKAGGDWSVQHRTAAECQAGTLNLYKKITSRRTRHPILQESVRGTL